MSQPIEGEVPIGTEVGQAPGPALTLHELGVLLVKHYGLTEGNFEVTVTFQIGVGAFGPDADNLLPSGVIGFNRVGLRRVADGKPAPGLVNAAEVNGRKVAATKKTSIRKKTTA